MPNNNGGTPSSTLTRSVRSCNCCPYGYHIDLDFVRYCEALANAKPSEEELQRRDRRRSRKSMEFMLGFESLFGGDWQAESRVQPKLTEVSVSEGAAFDLLATSQSINLSPVCTSQAAHESEPDSPHPGAEVGQAPSYRPRSSSVPRFSYNNNGHAPRCESPYGTASSTCSSLRGGVESDAGVYHPHKYNSSNNYGQYIAPARPANSPPETRAFLHEALDEVCSDFERTLERASSKRRKAGAYSYNGTGNGSSMDRNNNSLSLSLSLSNGYGGTARDAAKELRERRMGNSTWDRYFDVAGEWISSSSSSTTSRQLTRK